MDVKPSNVICAEQVFEYSVFLVYMLFFMQSNLTVKIVHHRLVQTKKPVIPPCNRQPIELKNPGWSSLTDLFVRR